MTDTAFGIWNGMVIAFSKLNPHSTAMQRFVAFALGGRHYHVECVFAREDENDGHFDLDDQYWTTYMGCKFKSFPNCQGHFNDEEWDLFFVKMDGAGVVKARQWLLTHSGASYNYYDAFMSAFTHRHLLGTVDSAPKERTLFCSEVAFRLLQISESMNLENSDVSADRCSPELLYKLLVQYKKMKIRHSKCRFLFLPLK